MEFVGMLLFCIEEQIMAVTIARVPKKRGGSEAGNWQELIAEPAHGALLFVLCQQVNSEAEVCKCGWSKVETNGGGQLCRKAGCPYGQLLPAGRWVQAWRLHCC